MGSSSGTSKGGGARHSQPVQMIDAKVMQTSRELHDMLQKRLDQAVELDPYRSATTFEQHRITGRREDAFQMSRDLRALAEKMGLKVVLIPKSATRNGSADFAKGIVEVRTGRPMPEMVLSLAHEIAHHVDYRLSGGKRYFDAANETWSATHYRKGEHRAAAVAAVVARRYGLDANAHTSSYTNYYNRHRSNTGTAAKREQHAVTGIAQHILEGTAPTLSTTHTRNH